MELLVIVLEQVESKKPVVIRCLGHRFAGSIRCGPPRTMPATTAAICAYPSDLTDEEWSLVKPLIPRVKRGGNKRTVDVREVLDGLMYVLSTGCQWRALLKHSPPRSTVNHYFCRWQQDGMLDRLHHSLYVLCCEQAGCEASPTAAIIDSQSVNSAEKGGRRLIGPALMAARRSKVRSAISLLIHKDF